MPESAPLTLDSVSVLLVWTAIAVYALAFVAYAVDLARSGAQVFITTTDAGLVRAAAAEESVWYEVSAGALRPLVSALPASEVQKCCRSGGVIVNNRADRVRVSPHAYNTTDEIDRLLEATR